MKDHSVLSFGYTRGLWEGSNAEDVQRMKSYAEQLANYIVVTNSYKRHRLQPLRLAPNFEAIPTNAFTPADSFLRMLAIGRAILRTRAISVLQAQDPFLCGFAAVVLGKIFHRPVVVCVFGPNVYDSNWVTGHLLHRLLAPIGRWVLRQCQCIQVDGAMTARSLIEAGLPHKKIEVKPMVPMNLEHFLQIQRAPNHAKVPRLLFVGRLCSQKNLLVLLEVVKTLRDSRKAAFELHIVGEGKTESELRAMVEREKLSSCVAFRGSVPRDKIVEEFAAADIFVLTSDYEGYPRVLMEAAAAALPIVTTAVSGSDEAVINGETGHIVPVRARDILVEKLSSLLGQPERRIEMGVRGRQHIRNRLDPTTNAPRQVAIWRKVVQPGASKIAAEQEQHLLLFNLVTDARDPILGFTTQWIRELAARVGSIDVITMRAGVIDVPSNVRVHSVGKEHGHSEPRRVLEFYRHLFRILRAQRIDGCFSHMMPVFSALGGPILRARRIPLVTWYAHPNLTFPLRLAHFFSNRMVTSLPHAYPYRKDKLSVIGQGIDTALFAPSPTAVVSDDLVLCAGRISRVKNHPTLLRAAAFLRIPFRLVILGATAGADDETYARELKRLASELGLEDSVTFARPVPRGELPEHYRRCAVHVNLTPAGFGDKVAWEAMSCGRPCLVANDDFRETLGEHSGALLFRSGDAIELAQKLATLLAKSSAERAAIGADLRAQVERLHSLPRLAERILEELARCSSKLRGRTQPHIMKNGNSTSYSYALCSRYRTTTRLLRDEAGTLLDVGSRDCILQKFLPPGKLSYFSADVAPGLDYQIDLEKPLPFDDGAFDHVVALDVLEHVDNIHTAVAEVLRITRCTATIALPNIASIRHRLSFLFRGRMGTDKYDLPPERRPDRHHWLTIRPQIDHFIRANAPRHGFAVKAQIAESESGALRPIATLSLALGLHFGGLFSARSIYHLARAKKARVESRCESLAACEHVSAKLTPASNAAGQVAIWRKLVAQKCADTATAADRPFILAEKTR